MINLYGMSMETGRLVLRNWRKKDFSQFMEFSTDPQVMLPSGPLPIKNKFEGKLSFSDYRRDPSFFAVTLKESGRVIGNIKFQEDFKRYRVNSISIAYNLNRAYWGCGYASEALSAMVKFAFEVKRVDVIGIAHFVDNHRSRRVIEKCGFVREGMIRMAYKRTDGAVFDEINYSLTKAEYENIPEKYDCRIFIG